MYTGAVSAKSSEATAMDYNNSSNGIIRHAIRASVPVSAAVELPGCATTVYLSGKLPPIQDHKYTLDSPLAYGGNTRNQAKAVLTEIEKTLSDIGLGLGDVVKMQVFLVG
ncbi:Rid family hydrolase, partial [Staphylococcus aureus]|uniref:Rid family hydrolase n=1 Tax=Staphylococcus aureus TaxID=1280 RepID=UPI00301BD580